ncbi:MAG: Nre family DNA repair protein [Candidatus Methanomethylophilaceae archaeon]|nr:Nre family DNA repair protein [Candidatus Methanomethylophilaceae archaeon]MDY5872376.1 Nre family DNA repair protein [Candidatus Methanomethylophilaceae archaeon]
MINTTLPIESISPRKADGDGLCVICKGAKRLCGKDRCPLMIKFYSRQKTAPMIDFKDLGGSCPPAVFVGRYGYPKVDIGPLLPPFHGDTSVMDRPEEWVGKTIDEITDMRFSLVRGKYRIDATDFAKAGRIVEQIQEIALTERPVDMEASFSHRPRGRIILDDEVQPFGPSARMESMKAGTGRFERYLERSYYDTDMRASDAVINAYENGTLISEIQKAFSTATMGISGRRRFVPTRWSITAVDDIIGRHLLETTRFNDTIDEYRIYHWEELDNRWCILMMPCTWRFELIEAWYPSTTWNPMGKGIEIISDHEFFDGRSDYASIGGCYYASRMAVNELLIREGRTAGAVIMREAHPGYVMPVGVWNVRENVRAALRTEPHRFESLDGAMDYVASVMDIPKQRWLEVSGILRDYRRQRRIEDYFADRFHQP